MTIPTPNIAGIFLNASEKETTMAKHIYTNSIQPILNLKKDTSLSEVQSAQLFSYIEHIQIAVITLYTADRKFGKFPYTTRLSLPRRKEWRVFVDEQTLYRTK